MYFIFYDAVLLRILYKDGKPGPFDEWSNWLLTSGQTGSIDQWSNWHNRPVVKLALLTLLWPAGALQLPGAPVSLPSPSRSPKKIAKAPPVRPAIKRLTSGQTGGQAGGVARLLPPAPSRPLGGLRFPSVIEGRGNKKSKKNTKIKL